MTFREKLAVEHPNMLNNNSIGGRVGCPYNYGYEIHDNAPCYNRKPFDDSIMINCRNCWDREIPEEKETYSIEEVKEMCDISNEDIEQALKTSQEIIHKTGSGFTGRVILDSGERREFETGAVRDIQEGKGRCDLMPLDVIADIIEEPVLQHICNFQYHGDYGHLITALDASAFAGDYPTTFLEVAKHFEEGAKKYGENNWQKGIPTKHYIDSAIRHYLKYLRGDQDEPHDRAFVWNLLCCIWTCKHKLELNTYVDQTTSYADYIDKNLKMERVEECVK